MKKSYIIVIVIIVGILIYGWTTYNGLVSTTVAADTQWRQVETQYQRRLDLIPNLVESTKGVMKQEQTVFEAIAEARTKYSGAVTAEQKTEAANQVESSLGRLLVVMENYPELKSSSAVQSLMTELEGTENWISVERMRYNEDIQTYNLKTMRFPSSIVARIFGFDSREYFSATKGAENAPEVKF